MNASKVTRFALEPVAEQVEIDGVAIQTQIFAVFAHFVAANACPCGIRFDIRLVRIINDHLDFGDAFAAGFVCISDGVIAALAAIDVLERIFASGRFELVRAFPAPDFAVPRMRAKSDGRAFFDFQIGRFVPFAVADFQYFLMYLMAVSASSTLPSLEKKQVCITVLMRRPMPVFAATA